TAPAAPRPLDHREAGRRTGSGSGQQVTVRWNGSSAGVPTAVRSRVTALAVAVAASAHFEMSSEKTTVYVPAAERAADAAPRWLPSAPAEDTWANRFADAAMSAASWPSTLSAFRPVATPVALVVNGAAVVGPSIRPTSVPEFVANENARPLDRLLARRHAFAPVRARQP